MKHGKNPTVSQCKIIQGFKFKGKPLNPKNWLVVKNLPDKLMVVHRERATVMEIPVGKR
ncbi:MAG: hypothetical protein QHH06_10475 [Clostridiales bacterium]|jgi:hypothetical protein|nr:hypothetical protein [Eubacteriales bacterium]MDH7566891.1 hypothetical protein [Clostridiales bacterium]